VVEEPFKQLYIPTILRKQGQGRRQNKLTNNNKSNRSKTSKDGKQKRCVVVVGVPCSRCRG